MLMIPFGVCHIGARRVMWCSRMLASNECDILLYEIRCMLANFECDILLDLPARDGVLSLWFTGTWQLNKRVGEFIATDKK